MFPIFVPDKNNYSMVHKETPFERDLKKPMMINNSKSSLGFYNLVVSKRDFGLFKIGLRPNRFWKFNDAKKYFGIKGNKEKALEEIKKLYDKYKAGEFKDIEAQAWSKE